MGSRRRASAICALVLLAAAASARASETAPLLQQAAPALSEFQRRLGTDVRILSLELSPEEASIAAQDPRNPAHVDRYTYRDGALTGPEPMAVGRNMRQIKARSFPLREVDPGILPGIVRAAPAAVRAEDGRVTHLLLERSQGWSSETSSWGRPVWRVHVEGPRGGGYAEFRLDGKRGRVVRW